MSRITLASACAILAVSTQVPIAIGQSDTDTGVFTGVEEVIVTAQKREQNANDVGMTIDTASGDAINAAGITDTFDLGKLISGFTANMNYYGSVTYTMRGIGFQDTALASPQTISVSIDEMPIPFSAMTGGAILDLERVEVLKGPQGTLFGMNTTGGAINYIANKPTSEFEGELKVGVARFNEFDVGGFLSGPITDTLSYRIAARSITSDGHYYSYTNNQGAGANPMWASRGYDWSFDNEKGEKDLFNSRLSLLFEPSDAFSALLRVDYWTDKSDSPMPQFQDGWRRSMNGELPPLIENYPTAPDDNRASDWGPCVNSARTGNENNVTGNTDVFGAPENLGNQNWSRCQENARDNEYTAISLRMDWDIGDMTLTSLTSFNEFEREEGLEADGTIYQNYEVHLLGDIETQFQELRLAGQFGDTGTWVVGANYEHTESEDDFLATFGYSTVVPFTFFTVIPFGPTVTYNDQETDTISVFGSIEYGLSEDWLLTLGARYTDQEREATMCNEDSGDGVNASFGNQVIQFTQLVSTGAFQDGGNAVAGGCWVTSQEAPLFHTQKDGFTYQLNEDNVAWKAGLSYSGIEDSLFWLNVTKGFKSGSFPTIGATTTAQYKPVTQEEVLSYELGSKLGLLDGRMQINAAAFFYDYTDKQVVGSTPDPILGPLPTLVNVPESEVKGIDISMEWYPIDGLRIAPSFTYVDSEVTGEYRNWDSFARAPMNSDSKNFSGQPFPAVPETFFKMDVEYRWQLSGGAQMYVGGNVDYQDETNAGFVDTCQEAGVSCTKTSVDIRDDLSDLAIKQRTLVDLRAGIDLDSWSLQAYVRNVTDEYYWTWSASTNDTVMRWTGMPRMYGASISYRF